MNSLKNIVENIIDCKYQSETGPLIQNTDFIALMKLAGCTFPIHQIIENNFSSIPAPISKPISKREHLVKFAKSYAEDLKTRSDGPWEYEAHYLGLKADYIVNPQKRTVVCLLRGFHSGDVHKKGFAKCHPDECFNEHIGKAIALSRALGEFPPCDFFNAPEPEGFEVGDIIKYKDVPTTTYRIDKKNNGSNDLTILTCDIAKTLIGNKANSHSNFSKAKVIDDSARY